MEAKELRIGNQIYQSGQITTIESISRNINDWERVNNKRLMDCNFIPLTEELFFKLDPTFIYGRSYSEYYNLQGLEIELLGRGLPEYDFLVAGSKIKTLHRLQNIFFALKEKELEISNKIHTAQRAALDENFDQTQTTQYCICDFVMVERNPNTDEARCFTCKKQIKE